MDLYLVSLATGAVGLGVMAIGGLSHGGHSHGGQHAGHVGHAGHDVHAGHTGHAGHAAHGHGSAAHQAHSHEHGSSGFNWTSLLSPRLLFALMVGFGAGGIGATPLGEPWRFATGILAAAA